MNAIEEYFHVCAEEAAEKKGLCVIEPAADELFVDIDDEASLAAFHVSIEIVKATIGCTYIQRPSPSGRPGRFHVVVTLARPVASPIERILLQTLLGSDRKHEVLSWRSATKGNTRPTVFFETPETADELDVARKAATKALAEERDIGF